MNTYIVLLQGISVGGNNSLPMKELVAVLEGIGARNARTYIQSGNAVFTEQKNPSQLSQKLAAVIKKRHGIEPFIVILELEVLNKAITENPFHEV